MMKREVMLDALCRGGGSKFLFIEETKLPSYMTKSLFRVSVLGGGSQSHRTSVSRPLWVKLSGRLRA